jgi:hypothetical protein
VRHYYALSQNRLMMTVQAVVIVLQLLLLQLLTLQLLLLLQQVRSARLKSYASSAHTAFVLRLRLCTTASGGSSSSIRRISAAVL